MTGQLPSTSRQKAASRDRAAALRLIDRKAEALRKELAGTVAAIGAFRGYDPGTTAAFELPQGRRLPAGHPIVSRYPVNFRAISEKEIESAVEALRRREMDAFEASWRPPEKAEPKPSPAQRARDTQRRVAAVKADLKAKVIAREDVRGFLPGSGAPFVIRPPQMLPRDHPVVQDPRFAKSFRRLTPAEIEHQLRSLRLRMGLSR
jgi:hypothetical protein